jgi:hypothetical protein
VNYGATMKDNLRDTHRPIANDNLGEDFAAFLRAACDRMLAACTGGIYICMSSSEIDTLQRVFREAGGHWSTFVIWAKNTFTMGRADYQRQYEPILYGWREGAERFWCGARGELLPAVKHRVKAGRWDACVCRGSRGKRDDVVAAFDCKCRRHNLCSFIALTRLLFVMAICRLLT